MAAKDKGPAPLRMPGPVLLQTVAARDQKSIVKLNRTNRGWKMLVGVAQPAALGELSVP